MRNSAHLKTLNWLTCLAVVCWASLADAADRWSRGADNESWDRIGRLQSVEHTARVRSEFVVKCIESDQPIERAAAVCWIARTLSVPHVVDLENRLSDERMEVRRLAWNAILVMPDVKAAQIVLRMVESERKLLPVAAGGQMVSPMQFPEHICGLSLVERKKWLADLGDREAWIKRFVEERTPKQNLTGAIVASRLEAKSGLQFTIHPQATHVISNGVWCVSETSVEHAFRKSEWGPPRVNHTTAGTSLQVYFQNSEAVEPSIYKVALTSDERLRGFAISKSRLSDLSAFPFFIRIDRSAQQEQEILKLLNQPLDKRIIQRLGELRAEEAVPKLVQHFFNSDPDTQFDLARTLSLIGDERAVGSFIEVPFLQFDGEGVSSYGFIQDLNPLSRRVAGEKLLEIGSRLLNDWTQLDSQARKKRVDSISMAYRCCGRPLTERQLEIGCELIERILADARHAERADRSNLTINAGLLAGAFLGTEIDRMDAWLQAQADDPDALNAFLYAYANTHEPAGLEKLLPYGPRLVDRLMQLKSVTKMSAEQSSEFERGLSMLKRTLEIE